MSSGMCDRMKSARLQSSEFRPNEAALRNSNSGDFEATIFGAGDINELNITPPS
jgi:hypothetical protein